MQLDKKIHAFSTLGKFLKQFESVSFLENRELAGINNLFAKPFLSAIQEAEIYNPWFTREFILYSLSSLAEMLTEDKLKKWLDQYPAIRKIKGKKLNVGIIMAGNIPLVGFHDFLTVTFSGHKANIKLSSKDEKLLPVILDVLSFCEAGFNDSAFILTETLKNIDAVIATGSNNSSRYFEYYFGKYPHIIRRNRNSTAILTGDENAGDVRKLADDIFLYFGMGCRSVSKIFLPERFNIPGMLDNFNSYSYLYNHNKYANNYDYYKAVYLVNQIKHLDTGFLLLKEDQGYSSPVGVVYYEYYNSLAELKSRLKSDEQQIQCIVGQTGLPFKTTGVGLSQRPGLNDYSDNIDTLKFLLNLYKE